MPALILFLLFPILEISLFIMVGDEIGISGVLLWILGSAILGVALIRAQGQHMIEQARTTVQNRDEPMAEAITGLAAIVGGILLIIPGFLTDIIGLAFALPGLRNITSDWLHKSLSKRAQTGSAGGHAHEQPFPGQPRQEPPRQSTGAGVVIEGDYTVVDDANDPRQQG